ncbi:ABC transporter substrate-binding protein [Rhodococcus hoagii]|nr:ABC transporter substrate-binding protein [Prescottella equi]NKR32500.1 ABC transporter substrate-binding protein [Prescottella equi]NKS58656.1 ABC transporter substrate-binding protein [Prescottella equi]NKS70017.1 ABC transporter substrate-binding protein [Prescottella equi]
MRIGRVVAAAVAAAVGAFGVAGCGSAWEMSPDEIVIGLDEDSTGPGASYSTIAGSTIRLAVDLVNADGGINGKPVRLVVENDESSPTKTPSIIRKLVDHGASAVLLATGSGSVIQAKSVLQQSEIPAIAPVVLSDAFANKPDNGYSFMIPNSLKQYAEVYCGAFEQMGYKTLGILGDASASIDGIIKTLRPALEKCATVTAVEKAPVDAADLTAQASRVTGTEPDAILVASIGGHFEILAHNTLAKIYPDAQRFSLASIGNQPKSWALADPGALTGMVYMGSLSANNPRTAELTEKIRAVKGADYQLTAYDAQAYDAVMMLERAFEIAGDHTDRTKVRDALQQVSDVPATFGQEGLTLSYGPDDHLAPDSLCGLVLVEFGADNKPAGPWASYQPPCG